MSRSFHFPYPYLNLCSHQVSSLRPLFRAHSDMEHDALKAVWQASASHGRPKLYTFRSLHFYDSISGHHATLRPDHYSEFVHRFTISCVGNAFKRSFRDAQLRKASRLQPASGLHKHGCTDNQCLCSLRHSAVSLLTGAMCPLDFLG